MGFAGQSKWDFAVTCGGIKHGTKTSLTMPNHPKIKASTLRTICTQASISIDEFLKAYNET